MRSDTALRNVADRKSPIGYWINSHIVRVQRAYHRRMCHQMHQQQIYYAVTCQLIRPCHHIIGYDVQMLTIFYYYCCCCYLFSFFKSLRSMYIWSWATCNMPPADAQTIAHRPVPHLRETYGLDAA